jgi:hypothetical protein
LQGFPLSGARLNRIVSGSLEGVVAMPLRWRVAATLATWPVLFMAAVALDPTVLVY